LLSEATALSGPGGAVSPRDVLPSDPKWLHDVQKGLLTELDLSPLYAQKKGTLKEDGGLPLPLLEKLTHLLESDTVLQKLSLRRCNIADPGTISSLTILRFAFFRPSPLLLCFLLASLFLMQ